MKAGFESFKNIAIYKQAHEIKEITITELKPAGVGRVKITAIFDDDRVHAD